MVAGSVPTQGRAAHMQSLWNGRVQSWDHHSGSSAAFKAIQAAVLDHACPGSGDAVADLGAGTGTLALALAARVASVLAVDLAPSMLDSIGSRALAAGVSNITPVLSDLAGLELPPASLDVIVSSYALHHLRDDEKAELVAKAYSWLRPGGRLVVADMMFGRGRSERDRQILLEKAKAFARKGPAGLWRLAKNIVRFSLRRGSELPVPPEFWTSALSSAGFETVRFQAVVHEAGVVSGRRPR